MEQRRLLAAEYRIQRWQRYVRFWVGQAIGVSGLVLSSMNYLFPDALSIRLPPELILPAFAGSAAVVFGQELVKRLVDYGLYLRGQEGRGDHQ